MQKETQNHPVTICFIHRRGNPKSDFLGTLVADTDFFFDYRGRYALAMLWKAFLASRRLPKADVYLVEGGLALWVALFIKIRNHNKKIILMAIDPLFNWRIRGNFKNYFFKKVFSFIDMVLPVSHMVADDALSYNTSVTLSAVSHYVDADQFSLIQPDYTNKHILFIINRPSETGATKGLDNVLNIFKLLRQKDPDWHLYIIGQETEKMILADSHIHCEGYQYPAKYFKHCPILIVPARYEAFSLSATEAACAGVIPLISSTTGAREFLETIDENLVTEYNDVDNFVEKIVRYYSLPHDRKQVLIRELRRSGSLYSQTRSIKEMEKAMGIYGK